MHPRVADIASLSHREAADTCITKRLFLPGGLQWMMVWRMGKMVCEDEEDGMEDVEDGV